MDDDLIEFDRPTWFPFNPVWFRGSAAAGMMAPQAGALALLICAAWSSTPPATIPNDDELLAPLAGFDDLPSWLGSKRVVLAGWMLRDGGRLELPWLKELYDRAVCKSRKAKASVAHRSLNERSSNDGGHAGSISLSGSGAPIKKSDSGKSARTVRARAADPLWDTVANLWHGGTVPPSQRSGVGKAVVALREVGATPEGIRARHEAAVAAGWSSFTPLAIVRHWHTLPTGENAESGGPAFQRTPVTAADMDAIWADGA